VHVGGLFDFTNALVITCSKYHTEISLDIWHTRKGEGICVFKVRMSLRITGNLFITTNTPNISLNESNTIQSLGRLCCHGKCRYTEAPEESGTCHLKKCCNSSFIVSGVINDIKKLT